MSQIIRTSAIVEVIAAINMENHLGRLVRIENGLATTAGTEQRPFGVILTPAKQGDPMSVAVCGCAQVVKIFVENPVNKGDLLMCGEDGCSALTANDEWHLSWAAAVALEDAPGLVLVEAALISPTQIIDPAATS